MRASKSAREGVLVRLAACLLLLATGAESFAQTTDRASREREMLRRSQAALQQAQTERDAAQAEKALVEKERDGLREQAAKAASGQAQTARALSAERHKVQSEIDAFKQALADAKRRAEEQTTKLSEQDRQWQEQAATLRQALAERTQANSQLTALLQKSTAERTAADERNLQLHALALELVERWRNKGLVEQALQAEPVLGLRSVRIENTAEELRARADALRPPKP